MKGQLPNPVQEVYSSDGWTQWNPLLSTENRPAHISSDGEDKDEDGREVV